MEFLKLFEIHVYHGYIMQLFAAELLFFFVLKHRDHFWLRFILSFIGYALASILLTNLLYQFISGFSSFTIFLLSLVFLVLIYENKFKDILFCAVGAQLIQNLSHNIENLVYLPLKESFNDVGWFFLSFGVMIIIYSIAYFFLIRRLGVKDDFNVPSGGIIGIAFASVLFCYLCQYLLVIYKIDEYWVTLLPLILCDVIGLLLEFGIVAYRDKIDENAELERFISQSDRYYESIKDNIDLLNMKAHDLKHFISDTRKKTDINNDTLKELEDTVENYECTAKTGNKGLDYVLTEKIYVCKKEMIPFSFSVNGESLAFLNHADLTSLFGNLISNAVECELNMPKEEKRYILLKVFEKDNFISIHIENYCPTKIDFKDGFPLTTKENKALHGYGLRSVAYITKKYHGRYAVEQHGDVFEVNILFNKKAPQNH